jgi:hypothetical protein
LRKYFPTEEGIARAKVELEGISQQKDEVQPKGFCRFCADNLIADKKIKRNVIAGILFAITGTLTGGGFVLIFVVPIVIGIIGETAGTNLVYYSSYKIVDRGLLGNSSLDKSWKGCPLESWLLGQSTWRVVSRLGSLFELWTSVGFWIFDVFFH